MESELCDRVVCLSHLSLSESWLRLTRSGIRSDLIEVVEKRMKSGARALRHYSVLVASYSCLLTTWISDGANKGEIKLRISPAIMPPSFPCQAVPSHLREGGRYQPDLNLSPALSRFLQCIGFIEMYLYHQNRRSPGRRKKKRRITDSG